MKRWFVLLIATLCLSVASAGGAQISTGNIYGTVADAQGGVLPGATVSVVAKSIGGAPRTTVTDTGGQFRFLNLDNATYTVTVELPGFAKQARDVIVNTGVNVQIPFTLSVGGLAETVVVTGASPVVDVKKSGTSTTLTTAELEGTPQSKDPWAMLKTVPGVIVDRVNVGGNESGQQSNFQGKGALFADTMWNVDGVVITDTTSGGASSSYFDFDAFDEVAITTGGGDLKVQTGGVGINFVTRRGTNQFKGHARYTISDQKFESSNLPSTLATDARLALPGGGFATKANHSDRITDPGFDIGGPIVKDHAWFWFSYGRQDIKFARLNQTTDETFLKNTNAKVNWDVTKNDQFSFFYFDGAKEKNGRTPGTTGNEDASFTWNQQNFYPVDGPLSGLHGLWKFEDNHVFGPNLFVNAKYAYYGWGYGFAPVGGTGKQGVIDYNNDHSYGSYLGFTARKPWHIVDVSGSSFVTAGGGSHEFKFGFGYRRNPNSTSTTYSGDQILGTLGSGGCVTDGCALVLRPRVVNFLGQSYSGFFGDTFSSGRLTVNGGVRLDKQTSSNLASVSTANPTFPTLMPGLDYNGAGPTIDWKDISPRVGITYALDEKRTSVVRASYARYAGQLNPFEVTSVSPMGTSNAYIAYSWVDSNKDGFIQRNEVLTNLGVQYALAGFNPSNPTSTTSTNKIDPNYHANHDNELIFGFDHELMPNLSVGAAYTYRHTDGWPSWNPRIDMTSADYTRRTVVSGSASVTVFSPIGAKVDATGNGRILSNRPDYNSSYNGIELTMNKRLSNRWMGRIAFSFNNWVEHPGSGAVQNPTRTDSVHTCGCLSGPQVDGGQIAPRSGGSGKGDIFFNAKWQLNANGFYQLPMGFELGGNLFGRQGYAMPLIIQTGAGADGTIRALTTATLDQNRYPNLWDVDFRLSKTVTIQRAKFVLSADLFNALNSDTVLSQNRRIGTAAFQTINEIISPRIARLGVKFQF
jgi:Carboxypeptidase regulatory-like domain/TonB-dependent Receptor Plug Domain